MLNRFFSFLQLCHSAFWGMMSCCLVPLGWIVFNTIVSLTHQPPSVSVSSFVVTNLSVLIAEIPALIFACVALKKGYQLREKAILPSEVGFAQAGMVLGYISLTLILLIVLPVVWSILVGPITLMCDYACHF